MKHLIITLAMALLSILPLAAAQHNASGEQIAIVSDTHLLAPALITPGAAIDAADAADLKMMALSDEIMSAITDSLLALHPSLVLITGDLTYNGERASHERMAGYLHRLSQQGITALVIPGNHDVNAPYAASYEGDQKHATATVTRDEFAKIYRDFGYGTHSRRDPSSLSYCCEPLDGVVVIGIDSNLDELNTLTSRGDSADTYHNGGRVKPQTLQWVLEQAREARQAGKRVIAMMHHHLVPHFDKEERLLRNYIVEDNADMAQQLLDAGIHVIFTGHLHVTDAARVANAAGTDSLVEVATGSAITYPFAMRVATLSPDHSALDIDTRWLTATPSSPNLREAGRQRVLNATPVIASMMSHKVWDKMGNRLDQLKKMLAMGGGEAHLPQTPQQATGLVLRHLSEVLSRTLIAVVEGNEQEKDPDGIIEQGKQGIRAMIAEVAPSQADDLWAFFLEEVYPKLDPLARSLLEDRNNVGTNHETRTDDLHLHVNL